MILKSVNLSLSSACGADCVFCPADRGTKVYEKNMPLAVATKIIDEMASSLYQDLYHTTHMQISENGDCFINKWEHVKKVDGLPREYNRAEGSHRNIGGKR